MVAFMNFILVKKGNKRKKIKKIAIYRKQNKKGSNNRICADAFDEQSDGIEHYLCKQACLKTCLSTAASVPQSRISFTVVGIKRA